MSKRKVHSPIILNYTGETVKLKLNAGPGIKDPRFKRQLLNSGSQAYLILPSLGRATISQEEVKRPGDVFPTIHFKVCGLPPAMNEVLYLVSESVAKCLSRQRNDLLILCNVNVKHPKNPLKVEDTVFECTEFAHVLTEIDEI